MVLVAIHGDFCQFDAFLPPVWQGNARLLHLPFGNMAMENGPVEDVFPIENGAFPLPAILVYSLLEGFT